MTAKKRLRMIDGLRGFSLLGILLANMLIFQYGMFGTDKMELFHVSGTDTVTLQVVKLIVEGSSMPIFTFMFGYGIIRMKESLNAKGLKAGRYFVRRFLLLIGLGYLHSTFLWEGDILLFYGIIGFILLIFMKRKAKTLLVWFVILMSLTGLIGLLPNDSGDKSTQTMEHNIETYVKNAIPIYSEGSYMEIKHERNTANPFGDDNPVFMLFMILLAPLLTIPMFLLGMFAATKEWFTNPERERNIYLKGTLVFIPIGLLFKGYGLLLPSLAGAGTGMMVGGSLLSIGYIFGFALWYTRLQHSPWLARFEAVGKLSLTNYLMQTVLCTTIFYGYGLGWFGQMGVLAGCGLAVLIYTLQLFMSSWYLTRFKSGPIERVLRMWTYFSFSGRAKRNKKRIEAALH